MNRRTFSTLIGAAAAMALAPGSHAQSQAPVKNVVLVHRLYVDGSSWNKVIPYLQEAGLRVTSVQNPLTSFPDDVQAVRRALAAQGGPTVLVGHSYGGIVISEAGDDPKVSALVFLAARAPEAGEALMAFNDRFPPGPAAKGLVWGPGDYGSLNEEAFMRDFAGDLPAKEARTYYASQQGFARAVFAAKTTVAAWRTKPSWYGVSARDRTVNPDLQRFMANRMKATTVELDASHVSLLSRPKEVADLILAAANGAK